ncbi:hypothetical protein N7510_010749 [Penicillium lagena]|uniref:uncharacterized protein n=1 Tax=Penicillium lagena TaxID=94218 RepID=UPI0025412539|nr:uncharacterized protein N7510_010749 [Penicillium lagena]KAJ5601215.1 hypothetical protein N7510_010749 [Penicillium lagena]
MTTHGISPVAPKITPKAFVVSMLVTGESEINAATTITSVVLSYLFDLTQTYFFIASIAGVNPERATTGAVMFVCYAVQAALHCRQTIPRVISPLGMEFPVPYPSNFYGTDVFEISADLRTMVARLARLVILSNSAAAEEYRAHYATEDDQQKAATLAPGVVECDVATSNVYSIPRSFSRKIAVQASSNPPF